MKEALRLDRHLYRSDENNERGQQSSPLMLLAQKKLIMNVANFSCWDLRYFSGGGGTRDRFISILIGQLVTHVSASLSLYINAYKCAEAKQKRDREEEIACVRMHTLSIHLYIFILFDQSQLHSESKLD